MRPEYLVGLGKTIFNSSVAFVPRLAPYETEIVLTERLTRVKNSGAWPEAPLLALQPKLIGKSLEIVENRDVQTSHFIESYYNERLPFCERVKLLKLERFSTLESKIGWVSHHLAHAWAALAFAPFETGLIIVLDGAGSPKDQAASVKSYEYLSLFQWKDRKLELLDKKFLEFIESKVPGQTFSEGIGIFYEKASEYIFNNKTEAGKVMGLAPFGKSLGLQKSFIHFLENLDWQKQFSGKGKKQWEEVPHMKVFEDLAATVQENFEHFLFSYIEEIKTKFPEIENLILTGGCAMNCTFNGKLVAKKMFKQVYIPPNPGDEGIGLGAAFSFLMEEDKNAWFPTPWNLQTSSRGLKSSVPTTELIHEVFAGYKISQPSNVLKKVSQMLVDGEIIAFFQGRSEVGPRSLGNRSILASPTRKDLKKYLNEHVKFREEFRPYGCTVQWDRAHEYFAIDLGFENPFMSFAVPVREKYKTILADLSHVDGTSRMQTLHREQNEIFYDLLGEMEKLIGLPILLNTSLNVMNEPIVETINDLKRFLESSILTTAVVGNYLIEK
ncbi:MAG: carbamoyltransferase C-terminal domain-containing protein [Bacteriovoracia bacterium]